MAASTNPVLSADLSIGQVRWPKRSVQLSGVKLGDKCQSAV